MLKPYRLACCLLFFVTIPAIAQTTTAYKPTPEANALVAKASQFFDAGKIEDGLAVLEQGISTNARDPRFHAMKGVALERQDKLGEAFESYNTTLKMDPNYHQARDRRMFISSLAGRPGSNLKDRDQWNERGVEDATYLIEHGRDYHQARGMFNLRLGKALNALADYSTAKDNLTRPVAAAQMLEILIMRAKSSHQLNLWDYATWDLEKGKLILEKAKANMTEEAYNEQATRLKAGLAEVNEAVKAARSVSDAGDLGELLKIANTEQKIKQVSEYVARKPTDELARYFRGRNLYWAGAHEIAQMELEKAVELGLDQTGTRTELFALHSTRGPYEKAIEDANFEINAGNKDPGSWLQRALVYDKLNRFEESVADYQYAVEHLEKDSPKDLEPRFVKQRLEIAGYGLSVAKKKIMVSKVFKAVEAEDPASLLPAIHPALRPITDIDELKKRFAALNSRFGRMTGIDWENFKQTSETGFLVIDCTVLFEKGQARGQFYGGEAGALTGFRVVGELFQLDTRTAIRGFEKYEEEAAQFFRLLLTRQGDKAYKLFDPDHTPEQATKFAANMQSLTNLIAKLEFEQIKPVMTAINQPSADAPLSVTVYGNGAFKDGGHIPTRMKFALTGPNVFESINFNAGGFQTELANENFKVAEEVFRAIGNRDSDKMLQLLKLVNRPELNPKVLKTFVNAVGNKLGPFQSIDRSRFVSDITVQPSLCETQYQGYAKFANATCGGNCTTTFGHLRAFSIAPPDGLKWTKGMEDTTDFQKSSQQFLQQLISGDVNVAFGMLPAAFHKQVNVAGLQRLREKCVAAVNGKVTAIQFVKRSYMEKEDGWRFHFIVKGENTEFRSHVDYVFSAFNGTINGFHFDIK